MEKTEYTNQVLSGLPHTPDADSQVSIAVEKAYNRAMTVRDAIRLCMTLEDMSPERGEEECVREADALFAKYPVTHSR